MSITTTTSNGDGDYVDDGDKIDDYNADGYNDDGYEVMMKTMTTTTTTMTNTTLFLFILER